MAADSRRMHGLALVATLLSFTQFKLDNGLTVLVHEDHTVPLVAMSVWYHVGSRDELPGHTGFAHLFEHMMFQGSAHVADKEHMRYVQEAGGSANASTNADRTEYWDVLPSNFLELGLWLESDRMGFLLSTLTQAKLDNQRDVVRNERRQTYENRPYGLAPMAIYENVYPPDHPYHHLAIGAHADLERATLDEVRAFFDKWYAPSNASIALAGDVDAATARRLVQKWFGGLPSRPPPDRPRKAPPQPHLGAEKRVLLEDAVSLERVWAVWPSPALFAPGDAELDLLAAILGSKSGRLYKRLVYETRLAQSVEVGQSSAPLSSLFEIIVTCSPGRHAADVLPIVDEEVARARAELVSARELDKAKNEYEAQYLYERMTLLGVASQLNLYAYFAGDPGYIDRDLDRYRKATADGLRAAAKQTLGVGRLVLTVSPKPVSPNKEGR